MARVLKPGGELRGTTVVKRAGIRQDAFVRLMQIAGMFGPGLTLRELESSLADAALLTERTERDAGLAYFSAHKPA
jgi:hypothetical protein